VTGDGEFQSLSFLLYWRAGAVSGFGTYMLALQALAVLTLHGSGPGSVWLSSTRWLPTAGLDETGSSAFR
jgi:hypothetical protein